MCGVKLSDNLSCVGLRQWLEIEHSKSGTKIIAMVWTYFKKV